jgi:glycosyltransferase involved in cell wall biosynthesis
MKQIEYGLTPHISIIIPTHNRCTSLKRTLDALCLQSVSSQVFEVLVVADGCTDDTVAMLDCYPAPFALHVIVLPGHGAATARNRGAVQANGSLLLFLDDDIEPTDRLVETHLHVHQQQPGRVVIGSYPPVIQEKVNFFQSQIQIWWENRFRELNESGHRFTYRDLLSGNLSLDTAMFWRVGGFDETIADCGGEDYEFGIRLIQADIPFTFAARAIGFHFTHETTDLDRGFRRARQEGRVDVQIGQYHPELRSQLTATKIKSYRLRYRIILRIILFHLPLPIESLVINLQRALNKLEQRALYDYWQSLYRILCSLGYWRGVADKLGSWQALVDFSDEIQSTDSESVDITVLDLSLGIDIATQEIDMKRPSALWIQYGQQPVGFLPPQPGAERLRGAHLGALLLHTFTVPCLEALAIEGAIPGSSKLDCHRLFRSIRAKSLWFGPTPIDQMWYEQYSQWGHLDRRDTLRVELPEPNWKQQRKDEYELTGAIQDQTESSWRLRIYRTLYRWHEPFYHWYSDRGWTLLPHLRQWIKHILIGRDQTYV